MNDRPAKPNLRSLSLQRYRHILADRPTTQSVLGLACSASGSFLRTRPSAGLPAYQMDPCVMDPDAVFVESAPMPAYRLRRNVIAIPLIVMLITGGMVGSVMLSLGFDADDVWLLVGTVLFVGLVSAAGTLGVTWIAWRLVPWPLVIRRHHGRLIVRLAGRKSWADLEELAPAFTIGRLEFVSDPAQTSPIKPAKLPADLRNRDRVAWLRLEWQSRVRWVVLSVHEQEEEALADLLEWADRFGLDAEAAHTHEQPPGLAVLSRNRRFF